MIGFIKGKPEVLSDIYGISITRILSDGDALEHIETTPAFLATKDDDRITYWSQDALETYISFVLGDGEDVTK